MKRCKTTGRRMTRRAGYVPIVVWMVLLAAPAVLSAQSAEEYRLKSAFLERFTRFVDWPDSSRVHDTAAPFVIGVIGRNPFGDILTKDYAGHRIKGKPVVIQRYHSAKQIGDCDLLFIAASEKGRLAALLERLEGEAVLTVGESEGFARAGVHINFYKARDKIRFEINVDAARQAGFEIASLLLDYARIVKEEEVD